MAETVLRTRIDRRDTRRASYLIKLSKAMRAAQAELDGASPAELKVIKKRIIDQVWKNVYGRPRMERQPPLELPANPASLILGQLALVLSEAEQLQQQAQELVDLARELNVTWAQIGKVAGVKPQSAYQRWSETGRAKHAEYQRNRRTPAD